MLFSGHNDRAVIALCRYFSQCDIPFVIVASGREDLIFKTDWSDRVVICRVDRKLDIGLFKSIRLASNISSPDELIICQTSEYLNQYLLGSSSELSFIGINSFMPDVDGYMKLTNKESSRRIIDSILGLSFPEVMDFKKINTPCVFKPKKNIIDGVVLYPRICFSESEAKDVCQSINKEDWFVETYVNGQSYYLCGYLSRSGFFKSYWQTNLMQQPDGKSIVFAKIGKNPGVNVNKLFQNIYEEGYFGPFMMEVIKGESNNLYFVEINPRFWGPLQLCVDFYPEVLKLFLEDLGFDEVPNLNVNREINYDGGLYSWYFGSRGENIKKYPELMELPLDEIEELLKKNDVYFKSDTIELHGLY
ncbi:hypothetical protein GCM10007941_24050 [Amphritea balenae]|nr:hypothetical protein GCM10007941_24050 [Amphritea balenae]